MTQYGRIENIYSIYIHGIGDAGDVNTKYSISNQLEAIRFNPEHTYWICVENYSASALENANGAVGTGAANDMLLICSRDIYQAGSSIAENTNPSSGEHEILYFNSPSSACEDTQPGIGNKRWVKIGNPSSFFQAKELNIFLAEEDFTAMATVTNFSIALAIIETCD
tara:strand:+ start:149 stop:649 length:501 start_codon:yes stop_codon:yes gene_type:complete